MRRSLLCPVALLVLALVPPRQAGAQGAAPAPDASVCLGFAFGAWTPKLDWRAVGHTGAPGSVAQEQAPGGRDWAAPPGATESDTTILLFPRWWPAGVIVALPTRTPAAGDTVTGRAIALVPRGDTAAPESRVRAWRVACRAAASR
jgi:hypothetical protein